MGRVKQKLIELEEDGIIVYSDNLKTWVLVKDLPELKPFDLAEYLFQLHRDQKEVAL